MAGEEEVAKMVEEVEGRRAELNNSATPRDKRIGFQVSTDIPTGHGYRHIQSPSLQYCRRVLNPLWIYLL